MARCRRVAKFINLAVKSSVTKTTFGLQQDKSRMLVIIIVMGKTTMKQRARVFPEYTHVENSTVLSVKFR